MSERTMALEDKAVDALAIMLEQWIAPDDIDHAAASNARRALAHQFYGRLLEALVAKFNDNLTNELASIRRLTDAMPGESTYKAVKRLRDNARSTLAKYRAAQACWKDLRATHNGDLATATARIAELEEQARRLMADAETWEKRAREAETALEGPEDGRIRWQGAPCSTALTLAGGKLVAICRGDSARTVGQNVIATMLSLPAMFGHRVTTDGGWERYHARGFELGVRAAIWWLRQHAFHRPKHSAATLMDAARDIEWEVLEGHDGIGDGGAARARRGWARADVVHLQAGDIVRIITESGHGRLGSLPFLFDNDNPEVAVVFDDRLGWRTAKRNELEVWTGCSEPDCLSGHDSMPAGSPDMHIDAKGRGWRTGRA